MEILQIVNIVVLTLISIGSIFYRSYFQEMGTLSAKIQRLDELTTKVESIKSLFEKEKIRYSLYHQKRIQVIDRSVYK